MTTTYSIHAAYDHSIVQTATPADLSQIVCQFVAKAEPHQGKRFYVHNGLGVVGAFLVRSYEAHDVLRNDYLQFDAKARDKRTAYGLTNDERK